MTLRPQLHVKLVLPFMALAALLIALPAALPGAHAQGGASLSLDADASNGSGPCSPVDDNAQVAEGAEIKVAVCLENSEEIPLAAFGYRVTYDDRLLRAPEVDDAGTALDDNPDANAGATSFSSPNLGGGWDCSAGVGAYPEADDDGVPGNGTGVAFSGGCGSAAGPNTLTEGPLGVITFVGEGGGTARLTLTTASVTNDLPTEIGSCEPVQEFEMECEGATIEVTGAPVPDVTPGAVVTPGTFTPASPVAPGTPGAEDTPGAGNTPGAGATADPDSTPGAGETPGDDDRTGTPRSGRTRTPTPRAGTSGESSGDEDDDGGGASWFIIGGAIAAVLVVGGGAAYWYRFRRA